MIPTYSAEVPDQVEPRYKRARIAAAGAYLVQGLCFAALLTRVPTLQDKFGFSDGELSLILLAVPVVAGVGSVLAGVLATRLGSAITLRVAGPGVCLAIVAIGAASTRSLLYLTVALFGLFVGAVDATMNMQGVAVQHRYGRSILMSFYGVWSVAGIAGSLATAGAEKINASLPGSMAVVAAVGIAVSLSVGPVLMKRSEEVLDGAAALEQPGLPEPVGKDAAKEVPWRPIILVGFAVLLAYVAESATSNWSAVYLHDGLKGSKSVAALGLGAYLTFQVLGRVFADRVVSKLGPVRTMLVGGLVGSIGMWIVVAAQSPAIGIAGFAVVGVGLCVVVPQSFSAAGAVDPTGTGVAIARVNLFNYVGFVVGAALIGAVAEGSNLRLAFAVPAVLSLGVIALAPSFRIAAAAAQPSTEPASTEPAPQTS